MKKSIFKDWKCRCSSLGHILTNKPKEITSNQLTEIKNLENERDNGINVNGNKVKWTDKKQEKLDLLYKIKEAKDELSSGIKTHLDNVFRSQFWKRRRLLHNKFLDKGNICESDGLQLWSDIEGVYLAKNEEELENDYIKGTPDNRLKIIRDTKVNYDMESFDNAKLNSLYENQIKGYCWLDRKTKGELGYCLVNNPYHQLLDEKTRLWYKMGSPNDNELRWIEAVSQIERNMIFDIEKWKDNYPNYDFVNEKLDFDVPKVMRFKKFEVELLPEDITLIKNRIIMCREYLVNKEKEVLAKIKQYENLK